MGKPTKILHNVAVGVVLNDVLDPLIAVLISATLRFSRMASSGLGNVDLSEVLFALENVENGCSRTGPLKKSEEPISMNQ